MTQKIGNILIIEGEPDNVCEICEAVTELRPYGPFDNAKGRRLKICWECGEKNSAERDKAFDELLGGKIQ
jgi:hypothetical protein